MEENKKKEAAGKISLFLEVWFAAMGALEVGFIVTKDDKFIIVDNETGLSSTFTSEQFQKTYEKWARENKVES